MPTYRDFMTPLLSKTHLGNVKQSPANQPCDHYKAVVVPDRATTVRHPESRWTGLVNQDTSEVVTIPIHKL